MLRILPLMLLLCAQLLYGDIIELKSGEKYKGEITYNSDEILIIKTGDEEKVIKKSEIKNVIKQDVNSSNSKFDVVELLDGTRYSGDIIYESEYNIILKTTDGEKSFTRDKIKNLIKKDVPTKLVTKEYDQHVEEDGTWWDLEPTGKSKEMNYKGNKDFKCLGVQTPYGYLSATYELFYDLSNTKRNTSGGSEIVTIFGKTVVKKKEEEVSVYGTLQYSVTLYVDGEKIGYNRFKTTREYGNKWSGRKGGGVITTYDVSGNNGELTYGIKGKILILPYSAQRLKESGYKLPLLSKSKYYTISNEK